MKDKLETVDEIVEEFERLKLPGGPNSLEEWASEILQRYESGLTIKELEHIIYDQKDEDLHDDRLSNCSYYLGAWFHKKDNGLYPREVPVANKDACIDCLFQCEGRCFFFLAFKLSLKSIFPLQITELTDALNRWQDIAEIELCQELTGERPKRPPSWPFNLKEEQEFHKVVTGKLKKK